MGRGTPCCGQRCESSTSACERLFWLGQPALPSDTSLLLCLAHLKLATYMKVLNSLVCSQASLFVAMPVQKCQMRIGLWLQGSLHRGSLEESSQSAAKDPLLGDILVVLAQLLAATQFIVEEKYLAKWAPPSVLLHDCIAA